MESNEFIRRFFWLIFAAVFSLFTFLLTSFFDGWKETAELTNLSNWKVFKMSEYEKSIYAHYENTIPKLSGIMQTLQDTSQLNKATINSWLLTAISQESSVQKLQARVNELTGHYSRFSHSFFEDQEHRFSIDNNVLTLESQIWDDVYNHSLIFMDSAEKFNREVLYYNIYRKVAQIETLNGIRDQQATVPISAKIWNAVFTLFVYFFKMLLIYVLGYFIVFVLGPIGMFIWEEKKDKVT